MRLEFFPAASYLPGLLLKDIDLNTHDMETMIYVLGFIIGALGTLFLLYFLRTRKTLREQNELIMEFPMVLHALVSKLRDLEQGGNKESAEQKEENEVK